MRLTWSPMAMEDRESIFDYIADENGNHAAAVDLDKLFQEQAAVIAEHPQIGRVGRVTGTREWLAHKHYVLVYDLRDDAVRILRVLHTSMRWPPGKDKAKRKRK